MNKKTVIIAVIVILCIILAVFLIIRLNDKTIEPSGYLNSGNTDITVEEKVIEDSKTIEQDEPNFMDRSGFEIVTQDDLQNVHFDKVYSQGTDKAQINFNYNNKDLSLFVSKSSLYENTSDEEPIVRLVANTDVTYVVGDDGINNYYYQKNNMYYSFASKEELNNAELEILINGFDTRIGENY